MRQKGRKQRLGTIDLDTGEIFEAGVPVWVGAKVKWHEEFFMVFQEALAQLSKDKDMNLDMYRVFHAMLSRMGFENWVEIPQKELAQELGMQKSHVSRAVKRLIAKDLIVRGPKIGRSSAFRLNSHFGWKGKFRTLTDERMGQITNFQEEYDKRRKNPTSPRAP